MTRLLPVSAAVIVLLFSGVVHGLWTDRWAESRDVIAAAARLNDLPMKLGDWEGKAASGSRPSGGLAGAMSRHYVHRPTGRSVTLFLGCGRPGPVSIHTPDVCYAASGFKGDNQQEYTLPAKSAAPGSVFYTDRFRREKSTDRTQLRIFWSWSAGEKWEVAENPRLSFFGSPILYKLYVIRETGSQPEPLEADPCLEFLDVLLPALKRTVLTAS
jgi:hypothetical protein